MAEGLGGGGEGLGGGGDGLGGGGEGGGNEGGGAGDGCGGGGEGLGGGGDGLGGGGEGGGGNDGGGAGDGCGGGGEGTGGGGEGGGFADEATAQMSETLFRKSHWLPLSQIPSSQPSSVGKGHAKLFPVKSQALFEAVEMVVDEANAAGTVPDSLLSRSLLQANTSKDAAKSHGHVVQG